LSAALAKPLTFKLIDEQSRLRLELTNEADHPLKCVEVLTIFLKDIDPPGGPSRVHIRFEQIAVIRPKENVVLPHQIWVDGKLVDAGSPGLARLKIIAGEVKPYVLDVSWQDPDGKTRFQRIPVGH
jgi:hypothetical protein